METPSWPQWGRPNLLPLDLPYEYLQAKSYIKIRIKPLAKPRIKPGIRPGSKPRIKPLPSLSSSRGLIVYSHVRPQHWEGTPEEWAEEVLPMPEIRLRGFAQRLDLNGYIDTPGHELTFAGPEQARIESRMSDPKEAYAQLLKSLSDSHDVLNITLVSSLRAELENELDRIGGYVAYVVGMVRRSLLPVIACAPKPQSTTLNSAFYRILSLLAGTDWRTPVEVENDMPETKPSSISEQEDALGRMVEKECARLLGSADAQRAMRLVAEMQHPPAVAEWWHGEDMNLGLGADTPDDPLTRLPDFLGPLVRATYAHLRPVHERAAHLFIRLRLVEYILKAFRSGDPPPVFPPSYSPYWFYIAKDRVRWTGRTYELAFVLRELRNRLFPSRLIDRQLAAYFRRWIDSPYDDEQIYNSMRTLSDRDKHKLTLRLEEVVDSISRSYPENGA